MDRLRSPTRFLLRYGWQKYVRRARYVPATPVFLVHIPKTAGTSFRGMLFRRVDQDAAFPNLLDLGAHGGYPPVEHAVEAIRRSDRSIRFLAGHYPYAFGQLLPEACRHFVFLREPVARTLSNLRHYQRNEPTCRGLTLLEIFDRYERHLENQQTCFLCDASVDDLSGFYHRERLTRASLDQALRHLEACAFVGITEAFSASVRLAGHLLGLRLGRSLQQNVAPPLEGAPASELIERIRPHLELDLVLYEAARAGFERRRQALGLPD